ncbi:mitochondrial glyco protein [Microstroma glucosiphilum]|uniref:Mitochondrial glyco protein n=1 Tax=Pseudomicrostroma glucosiphilum TaxID=1684307 RepID=A0A316U680_9BASI|nr:mitochondrial glyco protein [Pseudomicrostroma glucosiphilum]PWN18465.1 mitochondrial glyco protein [Pseudomicrostroma glucosiphilum]
MSFLATSSRLALGRSATRAASQRLALLPKLAASATATQLPRFSATPSSSHPFTTSLTRLGSGTTDVELASRLAQELTYEQETQASSASSSSDAGEPDFLRDFKSTGIWSIQDIAGSDEIALERDFGNERIKVLFSIGDIDTNDPSEFEDAEEGEAAQEEGKEDDESPAFPVRCAISITKANKGALTIDAQADSGVFRIENISFYKDSKLATELTAEADWKRRGLYIGPQFPTLDDSLQAQFETYLEERGIGEHLALFVPLFAEYKEQKEYCHWLGNVRDFVEA